MAVRALNKILLLPMVAVLCWSASASACFGPKLYLGTAEGPEADVLYALVTLYVQEKTGVESLRVVLEDDQDPVVELAEERVDLAFVAEGQDARVRLLQVPGYPGLVSGQRPLNELQFTTVAPAIRKLASLLQPEDVAGLVAQVRSGESAMAAVRAFYMERRWI